MKEVATGVWQLALTPRDSVNAYLLGDVLVDSGYSLHGGKVLKMLHGRELSAHALTHAHVDHVGSSRRIADELGVEVWAGADDVAAVESGEPVVPDVFARSLLKAYARFKAVPVARALQEGDDVAGFRVIDTPGHSPGHVSFWRESDRTLVCGDVFFNMHLVTTAPGLHHPPNVFTPDPERNRASQRTLAELEPELVLVGHGPPLRGAGPKLRTFVASA